MYKQGQNSNVWKDKVRIPTLLMQGEDKNFNVYKNIGPEFQC